MTRTLGGGLPRPWDAALDRALVPVVRMRRVRPDGRRLPVPTRMRSGEPIRIYPFKDMKDGDYFIVPMRGKSLGAFQVLMRQKSAQLDLELQVTKVYDEDELWVRVTRIMKGVNWYKMKVGMKLFDVRRRKEYFRSRYQPEQDENRYMGLPDNSSPPNFGAELRDPEPEIEEEPVEDPIPEAKKEPVVEDSKERFRKLMAEKIKEAKKELGE